MTHIIHTALVRTARLVIAAALFLSVARSSEAAPSLQVTPPLADSRYCTGRVLETMSAAGYTYVSVDCGEAEIWAAGPEATVAASDEVIISLEMPMKDFYSDALRRRFDWLFFVTEIARVEDIPDNEKTRASISRAHREGGGEETRGFDFSAIKRPEGGKTIAEIYANKEELSGQKVVVRGIVARFTEGVLGKNWIHLQDGTGRSGSNDLTVTTEDRTRIGDTVLVRGTVILDRDLGLGYRYEVLLEDATVTVE